MHTVAASRVFNPRITCEQTVTLILFKHNICAALRLLTLQNTPKEKGAVLSVNVLSM
jgi:hypothetical protein